MDPQQLLLLLLVVLCKQTPLLLWPPCLPTRHKRHERLSTLPPHPVSLSTRTHKA